MTFKVKEGIAVNGRLTVDSGAAYQQNLDVPSTAPTVSFDFVNQQVLDSRLTFTRASNATFTTSKGMIASVANNIPRFQYDPLTRTCDGLLMEEQRTNLMSHTEQMFDTSKWSAAGSIRVEPYSTFSPSGAQDATKLILPAAAAFNSAAWGQSAISKPAVANTYTLSVYVKAAEHDGIRVLLRDNANNNNSSSAEYYINSNTLNSYTAGTFTSQSATVDNVGSGWYRVVLTTTSSTETALRAQFYCYSSSGTPSGSSGIHIWGAQLEQGAFPTTYIPSVQSYTSRSSLASYQDSNDRLIKYAGVNQFLNTSTFGTTGTGWTATTAGRTYSAAISPSGSNDALYLYELVVNNQHEVYQSSISVTSGQSYTVSVYAKAGSRSRFRIGLNSTYGSGNAFFDVSTGTAVSYNGVYTGQTITAVGNGWYRCTATFVPTLTGSGHTLYYTLVQSGTTDGYTGDGSSGLYMWGPQVESGTTATLVSLTGGTATAAVRPVYNPATRVNAGTLVEPSSTNLLYPSNIGSGWTYTGDTVINNAVAPDGTTTAATTTVPAGPLTAPYVAVTVLSSTVYTASFYVKLGTLSASNYKFAVYDQTNSAWIGVDLIPNVTPVAHEWRRVTYTFTTPSTCTTARLYTFRDSIGPITGGTVYHWGAQIEAGYYASSLIPTTTGTATRAADSYTSATATRIKDVCQFIGMGSLINNIEHTVSTSWREYKDTGGVPFGFTTSSPVFANCSYLSAGIGVVTVSTIRDNNSLSTANMTKAVANGGIVSMAYGMKQNSLTVAGDGVFSASLSTYDLKYVNYTRMSIGCSPWAQDNHLNCTMRYVKLYPKVVSNTELVALTKY